MITSKDVALRPCPFCGSSQAPELLTHAEIQKLNDRDTPDDYAVCCVICEGGCGATGGYRRTKERAINNWNGSRSAVETSEWRCDCGHANASTVTLNVTHCGKCEAMRSPLEPTGDGSKST